MGGRGLRVQHAGGHQDSAQGARGTCRSSSCCGTLPAGLPCLAAPHAGAAAGCERGARPWRRSLILLGSPSSRRVHAGRSKRPPSSAAPGRQRQGPALPDDRPPRPQRRRQVHAARHPGRPQDAGAADGDGAGQREAEGRGVCARSQLRAPGGLFPGNDDGERDLRVPRRRHAAPRDGEGEGRALSSALRTPLRGPLRLA